MNALTRNLLRRTISAAGALAALALAVPSQAQQTVTLTGQTTLGTCTFSGSITVTPSGALNITCGGGSTGGGGGGGGGTTTGALFTISAPVTVPLGATNTATTVTRTGGTGTNHNFVYRTSGTGCAGNANTVNVATVGGTSTVPVIPVAAGSCTIELFATESGDNVSAATTSVTIYDPAPVTGGPTNGPVSVPADCPTPASNWKFDNLAFGNVAQPRLSSGQVISYPVISPTDATLLSVWPATGSQIVLTQGQQPALPPGYQLTEMTVSRCPGTITPSIVAPQCYYRSSTGQVNNNGITVIRRPNSMFNWVDQSSAGTLNGCYLADTSQPYYVNVRWTYTGTCQIPGTCGFSEQWITGPY